MTEHMNRGEAVTVTFTTSAREQVAVARAVGRFTWYWWLPIVAFVVVPLAVAAWAAFSWPPRSGGAALAVSLLVVTALANAAFWTFGMHWINVLWVRRGIPDLNGPYSWTLTTDSCSLSGPHGSGRVQWSGIVRARETPAFVLLYVGRNVAHFLPKRVLSQADLSTIRELLRRVGVVEQ